MTGGGQARRSYGTPSTGSASRDSIKLGLIAAPDIPEKIAEEISSELPQLLTKRIDEHLSWDVSVVVDPLTGTDREAPEILDGCHERMQREGWDLAVCLTDLPVYRSGRLVVADASAARRAALVSVPILGVTRLRKRVREATVQLVNELYVRVPELTKDTSPEDAQGRDAESHTGTSYSPGPRPRRLIERRLTEYVAPFQRVEPPDEDMKEMDVDARFAAPKVPGHLRLWAGMVFANRPWKILPSFKTSIAAAFGMAAWVLASSAIWLLADSLGLVRLLLLMVLSVTAIVVWIIVAHGLWEHSDEEEAPHWAALYNGVTALTMTTAVLMAYAVLFVLVFVAASVFVPTDYFRSTLRHPVGPGEYLILAWLAASLATIVGALGSTLEDEETVRNAVYGYRQRRRQEKADADDPEEGSAK